MLVLSMRLEDTICIGNDIKIKLIKLKEGQIRLGIDAPSNIPVDREIVRKKKILSQEVSG